MESKNINPKNIGTFKAMVDAYRAKPVPPPSNQTLAGQTAIVTGSNVGIGLECCKQLLKLQLSRLIMAVRSIDKGEAAAAGLRKTFPEAKIEVWALDMLSVDIAILNAGITVADFSINQSTGHETIFQVNYLSTAFLALLLLPSLKKNRTSEFPARLTLVSSGLAIQSKFPNYASVPLIPSFDDSKGWNMNAAIERYNVTKTLQLMFMLKLSEHVERSSVIINAVDPGFCAGTELHRELGGPVKFMLIAAKRAMARPLEHGAWTYIDAAVGRGQESHGCFLSDWKITQLHKLMYTPEGKKTVDRLWTETMEELQFADVESCLR